ncbi:MAG: hypothetical protein OFPII_05090 [Osedax symbiont Rs1]|nr:MAG: hypothetical protein OFPII_13880 [Osedax symbiont Rs1]EPJ48700.1 MAG: hypothetical protein OFPII_05090 [Osedax symbiont Rs1]
MVNTQALDAIVLAWDVTAVRKTPTEPMGTVKIIQFHCKTNIFTLKSRVQVLAFRGWPVIVNCSIVVGAQGL